jgi:ATP-dependent Clp protease protease subunit
MNEIYIYDEIGPDYWGLVSAKSVIDQLTKFGKDADVTVRINSPGGSVTEGQAIYNALLRHKGEVTVEVDALAASMGSYIAMAGKTIRIAENAMVMVHNPWSIAIGNAKEMREAADVLEKFQGQMLKTYVARTGQSEEEVSALLDAETWLTAAEAIEKGFADELGQELNVHNAVVKPGMFAKTPDRFVATEPPPAAQKRIEQRSNRIQQVEQQIRLSRARLGV